MGLIGQLFARRALDWPRGLVLRGGEDTPAGITVSPDVAMTYSGVFACVRVLAEDVSSLPLILYRRLARGKERATKHPLYRILHDAPNDEMTALEWRELMMLHLTVWGNAYSEIEYNQAGRVIGLWPLRPDRMTVRRVNGALRYEYVLNDGPPAKLSAGQVLHVRGMGDGLVGYSPIRLMRNAIGLGLAAEEYGSRFFSNGARAPVVLTHPGQLRPEARENLRKSWREQHEGLSRANRVAVLEEGMTVQQIGIPPDDAQFLQTRQFQVVELARAYRIPPHKIQELSNATFSNIEQQSIDYLTSSLRPWLVRIEQAISRSLLTPVEQESMFAEHLVEAFLRGDTLSRYQAYNIGRQAGFLSPNDIRVAENMNPVDGGDEYLRPLYMDVVGDDGASRSGDERGRRAPARRARRAADDDEDEDAQRMATATGRLDLMRGQREAFEAAFRRVVNRETADLRREAEKQLAKRDVVAFELWLTEFYREFAVWMIDALGPLYRSYARLMTADAAGEIAGQKLTDAQVAAWVTVYLGELTTQHVAKSKQKLAAALVGENGIDDVTAALDRWRDEWPAYLANRETVLAGNSVTAETYQANGVTQLRWHSTERACHYCASLDGMVIPIGGSFAPPDLPAFRAVRFPPLHEDCECVVVKG